MIKSLIILVLSVAPMSVPIKKNQKGIDTLIKHSKASLITCEAPVHTKYCSITITIQTWKNKEHNPKTQHIVITSSNTPNLINASSNSKSEYVE